MLVVGLDHRYVVQEPWLHVVLSKNVEALLPLSDPVHTYLLRARQFIIRIVVRIAWLTVTLRLSLT